MLFYIVKDMLSLLFAKKKVVLIKERTESVWAKFTSKWFFYHRGKKNEPSLWGQNALTNGSSYAAKKRGKDCFCRIVHLPSLHPQKKSPLWSWSGGGFRKYKILFHYKFNAVGFARGRQNIGHVFLQTFNLNGIPLHVEDAHVGQLA